MFFNFRNVGRPCVDNGAIYQPYLKHVWPWSECSHNMVTENVWSCFDNVYFGRELLKSTSAKSSKEKQIFLSWPITLQKMYIMHHRASKTPTFFSRPAGTPLLKLSQRHLLRHPSITNKCAPLVASAPPMSNSFLHLCYINKPFSFNTITSHGIWVDMN